MSGNVENNAAQSIRPPAPNTSSAVGGAGGDAVMGRISVEGGTATGGVIRTNNKTDEYPEVISSGIKTCKKSITDMPAANLRKSGEVISLGPV